MLTYWVPNKRKEKKYADQEIHHIHNLWIDRSDGMLGINDGRAGNNNAGERPYYSRSWGTGTVWYRLLCLFQEDKSDEPNPDRVDIRWSGYNHGCLRRRYDD